MKPRIRCKDKELVIFQIRENIELFSYIYQESLEDVKSFPSAIACYKLSAAAKTLGDLKMTLHKINTGEIKLT